MLVLFLILLYSAFTKADIVVGQCPKVPKTKFNCTELLSHYNQEKELKLLIYGFLPSTKEIKSVNLYAYNFETSISNYYAILKCNESISNVSFIHLNCGLNRHLQPIRKIGVEYTIKRTSYKDIVTDFSLRPVIEKDTCITCRNSPFNYVPYVSYGKYFAIWGCRNISKSVYDRGLWIFGANLHNPGGLTLENDAKEIVEEAVRDMNLTLASKIMEKMVLNENFFHIDQEKICNYDRAFYKECKYNTKIDRKVTEIEDEEDNVEVQENQKFVIVVPCAVLLAIGVGICFFYFLK